jgi:hypothetical protein
MAKRVLVSEETEHKIEEFAEDLGRLLGSAQNKAKSWLGQREAIVKHLTEVQNTASKLLSDLGHQASSAATAVTGKRRGRPAGSKNRDEMPHTMSVPAAVSRSGRDGQEPKRRKMSAKARKAISMAQKARWAKQKGIGAK